MKLNTILVLLQLLSMAPIAGYAAAHGGGASINITGPIYEPSQNLSECQELSRKIAATLNPFGVKGREAPIGNIHRIFPRMVDMVTFHTVLIERGYAVVGWNVAGNAGRVLLRENDAGFWVLLLCAGPKLKGEANLRLAGVPDDIAERLAERQAETEAQLPKDIVDAMDSARRTEARN